MNITRQCIMSAVLSIPQMREYAFKTVMQVNINIHHNEKDIYFENHGLTQHNVY
jgi:hypothetical protein